MIGLRIFTGAFAGVCIALGAGATFAADAPMRDANMQAGLNVEYYYGDFSHVGEVVEYASRKSSATGEPLANLDSRGGAGKSVLS